MTVAKTSKKQCKRKHGLSNNPEDILPKKRSKVAFKEHKETVKQGLSTNQKRAFRKEKARIKKQNYRKRMSPIQKVATRNKDKEHKQITRANMTSNQKAVTRSKNKEYKQKIRAKLTSNQKAVTRTKDKEHRQKTRANLSSDQKAVTWSKDKEYKQKTRAKLTSDQRAITRSKARVGMQAFREGMTAEQKTVHQKLDKTRKQYAKHSSLKYLKPSTTYFNEDLIPQYDIGSMSETCTACNAKMFVDEKCNKAGAFSLCCAYGRIKIPGIKPPPKALQNLYTKNNRESKEFRKNIRQYNSSLALSSVGIDMGNTFHFDNRGPWAYKICGQLYHSLGPIFPNE